jgi:hypothetical protein
MSLSLCRFEHILKTECDEVAQAQRWIGHLKSAFGSRWIVTVPEAAAASTATSDVSRYGVTVNVTA